jgi:glutamine synthetase
MMIMMTRTMILPAAMRHQTMMATAVTATENAGVDCDDSVAALEAFIALVRNARQSLAAVEQSATHQSDDPLKHAAHFRTTVRPAMEELRRTVDELETYVTADLWPMPTYRELLTLQ